MKNLTISTLDPEKLVKKNDLKEISNPIFFIRDGMPTPDGLLSNEIFGITQKDRKTTFAYIDLGKNFIDPLSYKKWCRMDNKIKKCVAGLDTYIIENGELIENENGENGIDFIRKNINKIKIRETGSSKRSANIEFIEKNIKENTLFLSKYIVIPAYYRDANTSRDAIGVGDINKLYVSLITAVRSLKESANYGLSMSNAIISRIQDILVSIYDWFTKEPNLSGKGGIIKSSVLSKSTDYASRLVISCPNLKANSLDDLDIDLQHTGIPLCSLAANMFPFILFWIRRFFENEFANATTYPIYKKKTGKIEYIEVENPMVTFSDDNIKKQIDRFINGYSNRFVPVSFFEKKTGKEYFMAFKGHSISPEQFAKIQNNKNIDDKDLPPIKARYLTWCDLIYMAAVEMSADKTVFITRFPLNDFYGQFPTKITVLSTKDTEPMYINYNGNIKYYKKYPLIRQEMIGQSTSNLFADTMNMSNLHLDIIGGDYDGDQVTAKVAFTDEANAEAREYMYSERYLVDLGGNPTQSPKKESIQVLYNLTTILPDDASKLTEPKF